MVKKLKTGYQELIYGPIYVSDEGGVFARRGLRLLFIAIIILGISIIFLNSEVQVIGLYFTIAGFFVFVFSTFYFLRLLIKDKVSFWQGGFRKETNRFLYIIYIILYSFVLLAELVSIAILIWLVWIAA